MSTRRLLRVESRLKQFNEAIEKEALPVVLKSAPNFLVATDRKRLPTLSYLAKWQRDTQQKIHQYLVQQSYVFAGLDLLIYHHDEFREDDLDVEVGTIIRESASNAESGPAFGDIKLHTLPSINHLASTLHTHPSQALGQTYAILIWWTQVNGFRPIGPWRELTYEQESPTRERMIEVQRPVMTAIVFYSHLEKNTMESKITPKPGFTLLGLRYYGKNEHGEISQLWGQFNRRMVALGDLPYETGDASIGLCITPDDSPQEGSFEYVAGLPVSKVEVVPEGFMVREVPEYTYAVFAHKGDLPSLGKTYEYIHETWLPQSGYEVTAKIDFEYYDQDFKNFAPDPVFYIYVPIKEA